MYQFLSILFFAIILSGCVNSITEAKGAFDKVVKEKVTTKEPQYKLGQVNGVHSAKFIEHLTAISKSSDSKDANLLEIDYTITSSALFINENKKTMFDNLAIKIHIKYCGEERFALLHYQHLGMENWQYDEALYHLIAQKVMQIIVQIEEAAN